MRKRDALRAARSFVARNYAQYNGCYVEVVLEEDGERSKSWSFGVHIDEEDSDYDPKDPGPVGYVHADGHVEGLYGVNR